MQDLNEGFATRQSDCTGWLEMKIFGEILLRRNETSSAEVLHTRTVINGPTGIPSPALDPRPPSPLVLPKDFTSFRS